MAEAVSPIHIISLEHNRLELANYDINRDKILFTNIQPQQQNILQFSNLYSGDFNEGNIMAINGPAFAYLLNSEGSQTIKSKLFSSSQANYDVTTLIPEQIVFLTMFYHIHCLAYANREDTLSIQSTFTEKFRYLVSKISVEPSSQILFGQNVAPITAFFDRVQKKLIDDERHHITFAGFLEILEGGATAVQNYISEGQRRFTANNNSTNTQATHYTSNTRRGLNAISNPSFNDDNDDEDGPEPHVDIVGLNAEARGPRSPRGSVYGKGAPSNYSVVNIPSNSITEKQSLIKTVGSVQLGNLPKTTPKETLYPKIENDPELLKLKQRLEKLGQPETAKVPATSAELPPSAPSAFGQLPPAVAAALKKGSSAGTEAPPVLRNSKGRPVRSSIKRAKGSANARAVTQKRARFPRGNRGTVEEITYSKEAPPSGVITNTENVLRGTVYPTYRSLGLLESRRKSGAKPEPPYLPGNKKKEE